MARKNVRLRRKRFWHGLPVTYWLIGINVFIFVLLNIVFAFNSSLSELVTLEAKGILQGKQWWTFLTSMFWHYGIFHLFVNMFTLFFLGLLCEQIIGRKRFLWIYFASGLFAAIFFVFFAYLGIFVSWGSSVFGGINTPAAGASGALFGLLGVLVMLIPRYRVYLILGPLIAFLFLVVAVRYVPSPYSIILSLIMNLIIFFMIFSLFSANPKMRALAFPVRMKLWVAPIVAIIPLVIISFYITLPIGNTAHLGGLIAGMIYGGYLRHKYENKVRLLGRIFR